MTIFSHSILAFENVPILGYVSQTKKKLITFILATTINKKCRNKWLDFAKWRAKCMK
jgi:hypothetical protein